MFQHNFQDSRSVLSLGSTKTCITLPQRHDSKDMENDKEMAFVNMRPIQSRDVLPRRSASKVPRMKILVKIGRSSYIRR
jgi:hypothetical protein